MAAQPGKALPGFTFALPAGVDGCQVGSLGLQSNGKLVVGGQFLQGGTAAKAVGLLDSSGNILTNFTLAADNTPQVTVRSDNYTWVSYLASGGATSIVRRYLPDLTADTSLSASCQVYNEVLCQWAQGNRLIVGGSIKPDAQSSQANLLRINFDGELDNSMFYPFIGGWSRVTQIAAAHSAFFLIAGESLQTNGTTRACLQRQYPEYGTGDGTFDFGTGANGTIWAMASDAAGRVVIGGDFTEVQGVPRAHIARIQVNGQLDPAFDPGLGVDGSVYCLALQGNGKVCLGGAFTNVDGVARGGVARLNANGTLDATFDPGSGFDGGELFTQSKASVMAFRSNGELLVGGSFTKYNGDSCHGLVLIDAGEAVLPDTTPGSLDTSFVHRGVLGVTDVFPLSNGRTVVAGLVDIGTTRPYLYAWQVDSNGNWTTSGSSMVDAEAMCGFRQPDDKVLISAFTYMHSYNPIFRYDDDFSGDSTFSSPGCTPFGPANCNFGGEVRCLGTQSDGKILVGGSMGVARLNPDGVMDTNIHSGTSYPSYVNLLAVQPDDRILIYGNFTQYDGMARNNLARLNADGTLDTNYDAGTGVNGTIRALKLDASGRALIAGDFTTVQGVPRSRVARLLSNGLLDTTFDPGTGPNDSVYCLAIQANGKICLGGSFTNVAGALCNRIARLNADGTLDASFVTGTGVEDGKVASVGLQVNGDIIIGGSFSMVQGIASANVARLHGDPIVARPRLAGWQKDGEGFRFEVQGQAKGSYSVQTSTNLVDWQTSTNIVLDGGALPLTNSVPAGDRVFFRLISQ